MDKHFHSNAGEIATWRNESWLLILEWNLKSFDFSLWIEVGENATESHSRGGDAQWLLLYFHRMIEKKNANQKSFKLILIELHLSHFYSNCLTALGKILDY